MATRTKAKTVHPTVRIRRAVDELFDAFHQLDSDDEIRALAPYLKDDKIDNLIEVLSMIPTDPYNR